MGDDHPLSGRLVPDLTLDDGRRVAELLHEARAVLLDLDRRLRGCGPRLGRPCRYRPGHIADRPESAMLIRPDGYVAWAADTFGGGAGCGSAGRAAALVRPRGER